MDPSQAEKLKAERVQRLLYVLIAVMILLPLFIFIVKSFR
jgi:hypothetical protein